MGTGSAIESGDGKSHFSDFISYLTATGLHWEAWGLAVALLWAYGSCLGCEKLAVIIGEMGCTIVRMAMWKVHTNTDIEYIHITQQGPGRCGRGFGPGKCPQLVGDGWIFQICDVLQMGRQSWEDFISRTEKLGSMPILQCILNNGCFGTVVASGGGPKRGQEKEFFKYCEP